MRIGYKKIAIFLSLFLSFMHPLALLATEVGVSASPNKPVNTISRGKVLGVGTSAASPGFGGRLIYVQYCTCTAFLLLFIYDFSKKSVIQLMYIPGYSKLLSQYSVWSPGPLVLGGYTYAASPCMVYAGTSCVSIGVPTGTIDFIRGIGTSIY